eukprot:TRINITY_DN1982_c0_g1_i5.p2 TRINITY_DN1982_c0_g1~~TRINITY_DN1982_c0_g1_i5.p2  ORF type:complete len:146 (-),score=28.15 TRINITY_DN1982_c0_g1_i5:42-479(-)
MMDFGTTYQDGNMTASVQGSSWQLTSLQREKMCQRIGSCLASLLFFKGSNLDDDVCSEVSKGIEKTAYTTALAESKTTTGVRPKEDVMKAYVRKLSELILSSVNEDGQMEGAKQKQFKTDADGMFDVSGVEYRGFINAEDRKSNV